MKNAYLALMVGTLASVALVACGSSESSNTVLPDAWVTTDVPADGGPDASPGNDAVPLDGGATPDSPALLGEVGQRGMLTIVPRTAQTFAAVAGQHSSPITFTIGNVGEVVGGPLAVAITGPDAADFVATASGCDAIAPGGFCTVTVVFTPLVINVYAEIAMLTVTDTGHGGASVVIPLSGGVLSCGVPVITSASSDLGSVTVGATGTPVVFTLSNSGDRPSGLLVVGLSSTDFVIVSDTCTGASVAPEGGSCSLGIALRPATVGVKNAVLTIAEPDGWCPAVKVLTGVGVAASNDASIVVSLDAGTPVDQSSERQSEAGAGIDASGGSPDVP